MSEKKAKEARRESKQIVAEYLIQVLANDAVTVKGNIDNFFLFRDTMNKAERAVLQRIGEKMLAASQKRIIT